MLEDNSEPLFQAELEVLEEAAMTTRLVRLFTLLASVLACSALPCDGQNLTIQSKLLSGEDAPGTGIGIVLTQFGAPVLNDSGQIAIRAKVAGPGVDATNDMALYALDQNNLALAMRTGDLATDIESGVTIGDIDNINISPGGQITAVSYLDGVGVSIRNRYAAYQWDDSSLHLFSRQGDDAPGTESGVSLGNIYKMSLGGSGEASFYNILYGTGIGGFNNTAIYSGGRDSLRLVARTGEPAYGFDEPSRYRRLDYEPARNDLGQTVFRADIINIETTSALYTDTNGSLRLVARSGELAPGVGPGLDIQFGRLEDPVINNQGFSAFHATLSGADTGFQSNSGVFAESHHGIRLVSREGDTAPGAAAGVVFREYSNVLLNDVGQVTFVATLDGPDIYSLNNQALYTERSGNLTVVARSGEHAPGTEPGVVFRDFRFGASVNAAGDIAFIGYLDGDGVNNSNNQALYLATPGGELQLIARARDLFDVNDDPNIEDWRTVSVLSFAAGSGGGDGRPTGLNEAGHIAFRLSFTDGTEGVFLASSLPADLSGDGDVDDEDLGLFFSAFTGPDNGPSPNPAADLSGDGDVDDEDLGIVFSQFTGPLAPVNIPEPASLMGLLAGGMFAAGRRRV